MFYSGVENILQIYIKNWHEVNPQLIEQLDFATSASGTYPVYRENAMNGLPTLSFDGVDDYLAVESNVIINDLDNFSIFVVTSVTTNNNSAGNLQGILTKLTGTDLVKRDLVLTILLMV